MRQIIKVIKAALLASLTGPGLLGWLIALVKPIAKVLNMAGDIDLLANYFGPVGRFLDTGWGTLTSAVVGAVIIGYAILRGHPNVQAEVVDHSGTTTNNRPNRRSEFRFLNFSQRRRREDGVSIGIHFKYLRNPCDKQRVKGSL